MNLSEANYQKLLQRGQFLLRGIIGTLNAYSGIFIHPDAAKPEGTYRREEDCKEICLALALHEEGEGRLDEAKEKLKHATEKLSDALENHRLKQTDPDYVETLKRINDKSARPIPWVQVKKEFGL